MRNIAMSWRPSHSKWRLRRMYSNRPLRAMAWAQNVAHAAPAMPSFGSGPRPKISSGLSTMSNATANSRKRNGVRESPAPRSAADRNANMYSNGIARKITRR